MSNRNRGNVLGILLLLLAQCFSVDVFALSAPQEKAQAASQRRLPTLRLGASAPGVWQPTAKPSLAGSPVTYLILTSDTMAAEFQRLADWKTRKGVPAVVRTINDVLATEVHGVDLPETLRNYIRNAYRLWGVRYVLLGGDTDVIPARYVRLEFLGLTDPISDLYYSCLDGDWNGDGDAYFGEAFVSIESPGDDADLIAEVYLGRAPVSNVAEARLFVDKTLDMEKPQTFDHQGRILLLAEVLFPANYVADGTPPSGDGAIYSEELNSIVPAWMQSERRYEAASFWPGSTILTTQQATADLNTGYGTVVHIGHGYRYTLSVGNGSLDVGDAAALTNGMRAGLFYMLNCTATAFDFESMAEGLLLNPNGGAAMVVGAAREAFPVAARDYQFAFFQQLYQAQERRVGVAMTKSREQFVDGAFLPTVDRWTQLVYTLLGDPEASVWARVQSDLQLDGLPTVLNVGSNTLGLEVRDGSSPLANALVAAWKDGDAYSYGRTDANGLIQLEVQPASVGEVAFTVTAMDHPPLQLNVPVQLQEVTLVISELGLQDDGGVAGVGNLDGQADAGETVLLHLPLRNDGSLPAAGISATLSTDDPEVTVLQAASSWPNLAAGAQGDSQVPFEVSLSDHLADGSVVVLNLELQHAGGSETRRIEMLVHAARLYWVGLRLDDARAGNGNGVQEAGEEVDLYYMLRNRGSGGAQQLQLTLESPDAGLEILGTTTPPASMPPGASVELGALTLRELDVVASRSVALRMQHLQAPAGFLRSLEMRLPSKPTDLGFLTANAADTVRLRWQAPGDDDIAGYHVERGLQAQGPWQRVNIDLLLHTTFRDTGLIGSTRYWYRIQAVDQALQLGPWSDAVAVSTNPPQLLGWPLETGDFTASSPAVADINADGRFEVLAAAANLMAWDEHGVEILDADNNALTWGVFAGAGEVYGSLATADLDPVPGREIVAATWDAERRFVTVVNGSGQPLPGWPQPLVPSGNVGAQVAPVVANLDQRGAPEILLLARDGRIYAWHADGSEVVDGDDDPATTGVFFDSHNSFLRSALGVADLDPSRPGLEIAFGTSLDGNLFVLDSQGDPLPGWPRTVGGDGNLFGTTFASGITIGDIDQDGTLEMIFLESARRLHAMHLDGTELSGFPVFGLKGFALAAVPSPALADIGGDSRLEIIAASSDGNVHLFDAQGVELSGSPFVSGADSESSPLVGNLDSDAALEVLLGNEAGLLHAWNLDGTPVDGFPIAYDSEIRATPTLADVDADGLADLVVQTWNGDVNVLALGVPWLEEKFPWPTYRGNMHRTGEFAFEVPTPVAVSEVNATYAAQQGVRFSWRGQSTEAGATLLWRLYRVGPFDDDPLATAQYPHYNETLLGELRGSGPLEFMDVDVEPGSWYAYSLELLERRSQGSGDAIRVAAVSLQAGSPPSALRLLANVPNPFNPGTRIDYEVPGRSGSSQSLVRLHIYDVQGRKVRTLVQESLRPGFYAATWNGRDDQGAAVSSGIYIARLQASGQSVLRKMTLLR